MIKNKYLGIVVCLLIAICLVVLAIITPMATSLLNEINYNGILTYPDALFGQGVIDFQIIANEEDWQYMLDNATLEEYIMADLVINGEKISNVGIRTKGNNSLTTVSGSDSDRYSFKIKFDQYVTGQTFHGLDKMVVNNMLGDSSYLIEYMSYDMMSTLEVPTPLNEYANISVNGESWGLYLALESYDDSFLLREFGDDSGSLYSVKMIRNDGNPTKEGGEAFPANNGQLPNAPNNTSDTPSTGTVNNPVAPTMEEIPPNTQGELPNEQVTNNSMAEEEPPTKPMENPLNTPKENDTTAPPSTERTSPSNGQGERPSGGMRGGNGGMGGGNTGGSLEYIDDNPESYSSIFENNLTDTNSTDEKQVIAALEKLSLGEDLEDYFNVDEILRYLAAHTFSVNLDSYSSNMAQNYVIYEADGKLSMLPWDYNYAFGGFSMGGSSDVVNFPIDTPVSNVSMEERPLISKLLEMPQYMERYHAYLQILVNEYISNGRLESETARITEIISPYVKADQTAFVTYEAYQTGTDMFKLLFTLRAESVAGQIEGTIPSTVQAQLDNAELLIDDTSIDRAVLNASPQGGRGMGGGFQREEGTTSFGENTPNNNEAPTALANNSLEISPFPDRTNFANPLEQSNTNAFSSLLNWGEANVATIIIIVLLLGFGFFFVIKQRRKY